MVSFSTYCKQFFQLKTFPIKSIYTMSLEWLLIGISLRTKTRKISLYKVPIQSFQINYIPEEFSLLVCFCLRVKIVIIIFSWVISIHKRSLLRHHKTYFIHSFLESTLQSRTCILWALFSSLMTVWSIVSWPRLILACTYIYDDFHIDLKFCGSSSLIEINKKKI